MLHLGILVVWDMPYEVYRTFTCNLTLTKLYNVLLTPRLLRERHRGYDVGLKPIVGGSIPSFLILG